MFYYKENFGASSLKEIDGMTLHREDGPAEIVYFKDGSIESEGWYQDGLLHREGAAAYICYVRVSNGIKVYEEHWYQRGKLHREDGPAIICEPEYVECYYQHGKWHRENGPAHIYYYDFEKRIISRETYYHHGKRITGSPYEIEYYDDQSLCSKSYYFPENLESDLPSIIIYDEKDQVTEKQWLNKKMQLHHLFLPSYESYEKNKLTVQEWRKDGHRHREDGPAKITFDENEKIKKSYWYLEGREIK